MRLSMFYFKISLFMKSEGLLSNVVEGEGDGF